IRNPASMLPNHGAFRQFAAPTRFEREHRVLRTAENGGMTLPLRLIQQAILVQVHSIKTLEYLAVINFLSGEFAIMVAVPFFQRSGPRIEHQALSRISARRPRSHVNHRS